MNFKDVPKDELKRITSKGGRNSGKAKRAQTELIRSVFAKVLAEECEMNGETMTRGEALVRRQINQAIRDGDPKAFQNVMNYYGVSKLTDVEADERCARVAKYTNEAKKAEAEIDLIKARTDAAENVQPDDGFIEAINNSARNDWADAEEIKGA